MNLIGQECHVSEGCQPEWTIHFRHRLHACSMAKITKLIFLGRPISYSVGSPVIVFSMIAGVHLT